MHAHAFWIIAALVAIFAVAMLSRWRAGKPRLRRQSPRSGLEPLRPGESYDTAVKLATVPNSPLADLWCQRLKEQGIEAFYKSGPASPFPMIYGGAAANPAFPT